MKEQKNNLKPSNIIDFATRKVIQPGVKSNEKTLQKPTEKTLQSPKPTPKPLQTRQQSFGTEVAGSKVALQEPAENTLPAPKPTPKPLQTHQQSLGTEAASSKGAFPKPSENTLPEYLKESGIVFTSRISRYNFSNRGKSAIKYLVIHDTGNPRKGAGAINHSKYFGGGNRNASAHYFVDQDQVVQVVRDEHASWHCGDGRGKFGITNQNSIGIELCINVDSSYNKAFVNTAMLVAYLQQKYQIPSANIIRHYDASHKLCPGTMRANNWERWKNFKALVKTYQEMGC